MSVGIRRATLVMVTCGLCYSAIIINWSDAGIRMTTDGPISIDYPYVNVRGATCWNSNQHRQLGSDFRQESIIDHPTFPRYARAMFYTHLCIELESPVSAKMHQ